MNKTIKVDKLYLSELWDKLPSNVLLNKGVTGCGGTYVELNSKRNSVILVPTIELAKNKEKDDYLVVYGKVEDYKIVNYLNSDIKYKKIIGTYDCLTRLLYLLDSSKWFLLIDEYHILFNAYSFRNEAILNILHNYDKFNGYCFMTATPLEDDVILKEIEHIDRINLEWTRSKKIKVDIRDTAHTTKEVKKFILNPEDGVNYHIFINSVSTVSRIVRETRITNYKLVCSSNSASKSKLNIGSTLDKPKKFNFYTSAAFEGCDIYDPKGKTIILCDTNISTTVLDISTLIRQIAGRLRDSIYKEEIILVLNTTTHRYANTPKEEFESKVKHNIKLGKAKVETFNELSDPLKIEAELRGYSFDTYGSMYVNKYKNTIYYDDNLRKMDEYNYKLIKEIYDNSISVISELNRNEMEVVKQYNWATLMLKKDEYTYAELEELFSYECKVRNINFNGTFIKDYLPEFIKSRKTRNKIKETYYKFKL